MSIVDHCSAQKEVDMLLDDFFKNIESCYTLQKPFVAYRKPDDAIVYAMVQQDAECYEVVDFAESGFVFAPFDSKQKAILFPTESCEIIRSQISFSNEGLTHTQRILTTSKDQEKHLDLVKKGINVINNAELQKVVLSRVEEVPISEENPILIFESLLKLYRNAFIYIWYHPKVGLWLGATPESLIHVDGQRFKTMSLAGTQPYDDTADIKWNKKNIDEQQLVTDYIESELKPMVKSLRVEPLHTVRAGNLLHLKSKISGILTSRSLKEIINTLHPTPAICGLPKNTAKTFIIENEQYDREFYTGFLGELNIKVSKSRNANRRNVENNAYSIQRNTTNLFVNLRCMQFKKQNALIYVGGGVMKDSNPKEEWEETLNKAQTMLKVLQ